MTHPVRKILSLDGGGIKGVFAASLLASVEESLGLMVGDYFDLIVGTSTGGILALGLGMGLPAKRILEFYETYGPRIFRRSWLSRFYAPVFLGKYDPGPLRSALQDVFGTAKLGDSKKRLVIPSMNLETGEVHVFKTAHHPRLQTDYRVSVIDVAMATSAAPTYFPAYRPDTGAAFIDGGMWANNPVGAAVVEAISVLDWQASSLKVLSIGCTAEPLDVGWGRKLSLGGLYWGAKVVSVMMSGQSSGSLGTAQLLAGNENVTRISPVVPCGRFRLDATREMDALRGLGSTEARKALPSLKSTFFSEQAETFIHSPNYAASSLRQ